MSQPADSAAPAAATPAKKSKAKRKGNLTAGKIAKRFLAYLLWMLLVTYSLPLAQNIKNYIRAVSEGYGKFWGGGKIQYCWWIFTGSFIVAPIAIGCGMDPRWVTYIASLVLFYCIFTACEDLTGLKFVSVALLIILGLVLIAWASDHWNVPVIGKFAEILREQGVPYDIKGGMIIGLPIGLLCLFDHFKRKTLNYIVVEDNAVKHVENGVTKSSGRVFSYIPLRGKKERGKDKNAGNLDVLELISCLAGPVVLRSKTSRAPSIYMEDVAGFWFVLEYFFRTNKSVTTSDDEHEEELMHDDDEGHEDADDNM